MLKNPCKKIKKEVIACKKQLKKHNCLLKIEAYTKCKRAIKYGTYY